MLAVSGTEGVHNVAVSVRSELLGEILLAALHLLLCLVVLWSALLHAYWLAFLLWIEAEVLQKQSLTWLQCGNLCVGIGAVGSKLHLHAEVCAYVLNNLCERKFFLHLALWLAHVAHHDECATVGEHLLQCRQSTLDTGLVGYNTILIQWHVEVHTNNCLLTGKVKLIDIHNFYLLKCLIYYLNYFIILLATAKLQQIIQFTKHYPLFFVFLYI